MVAAAYFQVPPGSFFIRRCVISAVDTVLLNKVQTNHSSLAKLLKFFLFREKDNLQPLPNHPVAG
jgi:hypothetical protein